MNIILVIFDSLRKDCISAYGKPPWGRIDTPHFEAFSRESLIMTRAFPESLPGLPARRAIYTGKRAYPFHPGGMPPKNCSPGWGPIPENQATLAEILSEAGYRTGLISDMYHQFAPSGNYWRGFDQWMFLRGQELDPARSGPELSQAELDQWLPREMQHDDSIRFIRHCVLNMRDRRYEEDYFAPRVFREAALWLEQNQDAARFFLTVECFDPHEPWLTPPHYLRRYMPSPSHEALRSNYADDALNAELYQRTQANYSANVALCDRWFGFFLEQMRVLGRLEDTLLIVTSDHGHSIGEQGYCGKRGHPSRPEVLETPLLLRFPSGDHGGKTSDMLVQHVDIAGVILKAADVLPPRPIDGESFVENALLGNPGPRTHVTIGWGADVTVITKRWWFNCTVLGTKRLLYDLQSPRPFDANVAEHYPDVLEKLFAIAVQDAGGAFPSSLLEEARR